MYFVQPSGVSGFRQLASLGSADAVTDDYVDPSLPSTTSELISLGTNVLWGVGALVAYNTGHKKIATVFAAGVALNVLTSVLRGFGS